MRRLSDEEIQQIVEEKLQLEHYAVEDKENLRLYASLFDALDKNPEESLSHDFADKVVQKISKRNEVIDTIKFYAFIVVLIMLFSAVTMATIAYADLSYAQNILGRVSKFKEAIVFGLICIPIIQVLDQLLVKNSSRTRTGISQNYR